jgi:multisubunit Na+/H+ antiporter MnhB subunit
MKWIVSAYVLTILACIGFVLANREPGLGVVGIVVIAGAVAVLATLLLILSLFWRRWRRQN